MHHDFDATCTTGLGSTTPCLLSNATCAASGAMDELGADSSAASQGTAAEEPQTGSDDRPHADRSSAAALSDRFTGGDAIDEWSFLLNVEPPQDDRAVNELGLLGAAEALPTPSVMTPPSPTNDFTPELDNSASKANDNGTGDREPEAYDAEAVARYDSSVPSRPAATAARAPAAYSLQATPDSEPAARHVVWTVAGKDSTSGHVDGSSEFAMFDTPMAVAVLPSDNPKSPALVVSEVSRTPALLRFGEFNMQGFEVQVGNNVVRELRLRCSSTNGLWQAETVSTRVGAPSNGDATFTPHAADAAAARFMFPSGVAVYTPPSHQSTASVRRPRRRQDFVVVITDCLSHAVAAYDASTGAVSCLFRGTAGQSDKSKARSRIRRLRRRLGPATAWASVQVRRDTCVGVDCCCKLVVDAPLARTTVMRASRLHSER